ncbi:MAG: DUF192 domain-containing protein [Armatimonadetes bacterium]|nr:DUF192 domain-containing protein [Armatimonadota bacterium]
MKIAAAIALCVCLTACNKQKAEPATVVEPPPKAGRKFALASYDRATISVKRHKIDVYVADDQDKQTEGLMFVEDGELGADEGMIFVFPDEQYRSFWMKNTLIPLDIAYLKSDGTILNIVRMEPLMEIGYPSEGLARFAVEMKAGWFEKNGVKHGARFELSGLANRR